MKGYKLDLLTLLISLFILGACQNPDEIGLDVDPADGINTVMDSSTTVLAVTVPEDKVFTNNLSQYPVGYFIDPDLGVTKAAVAASINLPSDTVKFGTNAVLDSAVLVLKYGTVFYGDSLNSDFKFTVHQLTNKLVAANYYYHNTAIPYDAAEIGTLTMSKIKLDDTIQVRQIIKGKPDTLKDEYPQIRIPLNSSFINANFLNAAASKFYTNKSFQDHIKGLYVKMEQPANSKPGGIVYFDMSNGSSKLELYYRNVNATIDTNQVTFAINSINPVAANFSHDYTGTEVETQLNNPAQTYTKTFVQAMGGVRTKITLPDLSNLKALGNIVINKALLEVKIENGSDNPFAPAPRLMLYRTDIAGQRQFMPDVNPYDPRSVGAGLFGGFYDSSTQTYRFVVTAYLQDLLSGKAKQYAAYLAAISPFESNLGNTINPSGIEPSRAVLGSGTHPTRRLKLKVIYTKLNN